MHEDRNRIRLLVPLALPHRLQRRLSLAVRLCVHRPLDLHDLRRADDLFERRMLRTQVRALQQDVPSALLRRKLPKDDDVDGGGIVQREDQAVKIGWNVWVSGQVRLGSHGPPTTVKEVPCCGYPQRYDVGVLEILD